jgi:Tfp pilus assembly protein PilX
VIWAHQSYYRQAKGAVLILCLLMLTALSVLGLAAASDHILQARIAGNAVGSSEMEVSADAGLLWGESWLFGFQGLQMPDSCQTACQKSDLIKAEGFYDFDSVYDNEWWEANAYPVGFDPVSGMVLSNELALHHAKSHWLIEEVHHLPKQVIDDGVTDIGYYRILARGTSDTSTVYSLTESIIARPWGDVSLQDNFPSNPTSTEFCDEISAQTPCGRLAWRKVR